MNLNLASYGLAKKVILIGVLFAGFIVPTKLVAQHPNPNILYGHSTKEVYGYNVVTKAFKENLLTLPDNGRGLAVCPDLKKKNGNMGFYTTVRDTIYFHDGTGWVSTGHYGGAVNLGGSKDYLYMLEGGLGVIYRYDGKGNAVRLVKLENFVGPYDLVGDSANNFYLVQMSLEKVMMYNWEGKLVKSYDLPGLSENASGGGFGSIKNIFYANIANGFMEGSLVDNKIKFSYSTIFPKSISDMASWPINVIPDTNTYVEEVAIDTVKPQTDAVYGDKNIPVQLLNRDVSLQSTLVVDQPEFEIMVYDQSVVDGDSISLFLNGKWILENYPVVKTKFKIHLKIDPNVENNYLVLYALNLGDISPNTAAVQVLVNGKEYKLTLTSDLKKSGALNFSYVPK